MSALSRRGVFGALPAAAQLDAELIQFCAQHGINRDAFNNDPADDEGGTNPLYIEYSISMDFIDCAEPQTMAGLVAKAKAAIGESLDIHGKENPKNSHAAAWAWDLVHDILRLGGGVMSAASHVEILKKSVHRSYGIATALMFMTEIDLGDDPVRVDTFRNAVEELAGALKDILVVTLEFDLAGERKAEGLS